VQRQRKHSTETQGTIASHYLARKENCEFIIEFGGLYHYNFSFSPSLFIFLYLFFYFSGVERVLEQCGRLRLLDLSGIFELSRSALDCLHGDCSHRQPGVPLSVVIGGELSQ
jgi:hypothetical protein